MKDKRVWRINLKPGGKDSDFFCIGKNILGIGWPVKNGKSGMTCELYLKIVQEQFDPQWIESFESMFNPLHDEMKIGDFCWTKDRTGTYYLGEITGEWEYRAEMEYLDADIVNIRQCNWLRIGGVEELPIDFPNIFTPKVIQPVTNQLRVLYSKLMYSQVKSVSRDLKLVIDLANYSNGG